MSLRIEANGGMDEDGNPVVEVLFSFTVPLKDADQISRLIKIGGTRAVLAVGDARQKEEAAAAALPPVTGPHSVDGQCVSDPAADAAALEADYEAMRLKNQSRIAAEKAAFLQHQHRDVVFRGGSEGSVDW